MYVLKEVLGEDFFINGKQKRPGPVQKFTDTDIIALNFAAEYSGFNSEYRLFSILESDYKHAFPYLISRRHYNDRRKQLFDLIEYIRDMLACRLNAINEVYAIDSMPLDVCKLSRMLRNKMGKGGDYYSPNHGYCASQKRYFFGYKLHIVCSPNGVIQVLDLTQASVHDIHFLKNIKDLLSNCIITGDRGYISNDIKKELFEKAKICMEVPSRSNQKSPSKVMRELRRIRKRAETVFSQLCKQFRIQENLATTFLGYRTRILSKITSMTVMNYINKFITNRPIGHVQYALKYMAPV